MSKLAMLGGQPVWTGEWPNWPQPNPDGQANLTQVYQSPRWAISGSSAGNAFFERQFSRAFADYCQVDYCIPTSHGSSALLIALEALDIGPSDEVIVPALTWVATASAVTNVGAIPIIVDVDPKTFCIDPQAVKDAITPQTKAIMPVHINGCLADMDTLLEISTLHNIPVIEDCAHAHGARWKDQPSGSIGVIGAFSMQRGKLLTCGEGGAVVTNVSHLAEKLEQLRADGRKYNNNGELEDKGDIQGTNYCLSEFQSAVLVANLDLLDSQHQTRLENAQYLENLLLSIDGVRAVIPDARVTKRAFYCYGLQVNLDIFGNKSIETVRRALSAELNYEIWTTYDPLYKCNLYSPLSKRRFLYNDEQLLRLDPTQFYCSNAEYIRNTCLELHHSMFLSGRQEMEAIAEAIVKVKSHCNEL